MRLQFAVQCQPGVTGEVGEASPYALAYLLSASAPGQVNRPVVRHALRNGTPTPFDRAVTMDLSNDNSAIAGLAEHQWFGIARIRVPLTVCRAVEVSDKRVLQSAVLDLVHIEGCMRLLALALEGKAGAK